MSKALTRTEVGRIAELARLELTDDELDLFTRQLGDILGYVDQIDALTSGQGPGMLPEWLKNSADALAERALSRDKLASKDQATREGLLTYLRIASNHFRRRLIDLQDAEEAERLCAAIDAVVQAEGYVESNVNVPLVVQQFASALERLFSISPSPAGRGPG